MSASLTFQSLAGRCFTLLSCTLQILHSNQSWSHSVEPLPLCILIYSASRTQMAARSQVSLWHRLGADTMCWPSAHAWPVTSPPRACDAYLECCILTGCFFKRCQGLILGLVWFFFRALRKKCFYTSQDALISWRGEEKRGCFTARGLTELCPYERVICFRPLCSEKRHRGWGMRTAKRVPVFTQTHGNRARPQPQACKHSHFDFSRLALANPYFSPQIYSCFHRAWTIKPVPRIKKAAQLVFMPRRAQIKPNLRPRKQSSIAHVCRLSQKLICPPPPPPPSQVPQIHYPIAVFISDSPLICTRYCWDGVM